MSPSRKRKLIFLVDVLLGFTLSKGIAASDARLSAEKRLHKRLFNESYYSVDLLPRHNLSTTINVQFALELIKIVEVNAKEQSMTVYGWVRQKWENPSLRWNKSEFDGIDRIFVEPKRVWVPDILLYNNKDEQDHFGGGRTSYRSGITLFFNGTNVWFNPMIFNVLCRVKVTYFPFDNQTCKLKFGSWMHDATTFDITPIKNLTFPTKHYQENGEWEIYKVKMKRNIEHYQCCKEPFVDITVTIEMGRESMDYFINYIVPCCLISSMIFLGFILPPESGERIGLSITVLLAMTVFQQLTSEIMPSYDFPILGQYYFAIILEIGASVVVTTTILNFYHRTNRRMPRWMRTLVIEWMATIVFLRDTPEKRKIQRRKSSRRSRRRKQQSIINDVCKRSFKKKQEEMKDQHNQGFNVTFGDTIYCGPSNTESLGAEMENLGIQLNYGVNKYPFKSSNETLDDQLKKKEEARPYMDDNEALSEDELAIRHWEWTLVARILDRFFLVIAVICGIVTVAAIFLRAPKLWSDFKMLSIDNPEPLVDE